jgi:cytochrome c peroxidase
MKFPTLQIARFIMCFVLVARLGAVEVDSSREPLVPLPVVPQLDAGKVSLGSRLFEDKRFSRDGSLSCASCHDLRRGGVDSRPASRVFSAGIGNARHVFNTPTVYNASLNYRQQWTGGARTLEEVVDKVVTSPLVFDSNWAAVLKALAAAPALAAEFARLYPQRGLAKPSVEDALATYQRSLLTPSRFDRYLRGDVGAISGAEKRGYERFKAYGCVGCHQGVNIGGNMLQRFGTMRDYFADRARAGVPAAAGDAGRFRVTKKNDDLHVFKIPSLRNVALTAPYFHDGSAATLEEAVDVMFRYQLGREAPSDDKELIVKFLRSLSGEQLTVR